MSTTKRNRCTCGKAMSKYATRCKACEAARSTQLRTEGLAQIQSGRCPNCGQPIRRNLAITDWFQCAGYGAEGFRDAGSKPCSWQVILPKAR